MRRAQNRPKMTEQLTIYTVYCKPIDHPLHYVVRKFYIMPDLLAPIADKDCQLFDDLAAVHETMNQKGLRRIPRSEEDDPVIVECWI